MSNKKLPTELTAQLLEDGWTPTKIVTFLRDHLNIEVTANSISQFRRRHTHIAPAHDSQRRLPWKIDRLHQNSVYRHAILAWHQREHDHPLSAERARNLMAVETRLKEAGKVIDYGPVIGFFVVPARDGIDLGIVREPSGRPRPATRGPYALRAAVRA
ncbi:MAG: hypothetical protein FWF90_18220 [Promicromonosporaceae bacterium]|nr:hypothetical protein [Promicromonosporaceae bacterium]